MARDAAEHTTMHRTVPNISRAKDEKRTLKDLRKMHSQHYALIVSGITGLRFKFRDW